MTTRKLTLDDLNRDGKVHKRALQVYEVRAIDQEKRTVELAFSSEAEVERWYGVEILDHSAGSVVMDRMRNGAAGLVNHDWDDQVAVVESAEIGADRKGRCVLRFGRSARAQEIFQDVVDGIRRLVSVGYIVHDWRVDGERDGVEIVRITRWEPYEVSIVSVPADTTVGVGRDAKPATAPEEKPIPANETDNVRNNSANRTEPSTKGTAMKEKIMRHNGDLIRAEVDEAGNYVRTLEVIEKAGAERSAGVDGERARSAEILALGDQFNEPALAAQYVRDGKTAGDFQRALLDKVNERAKKPLNDQARDADLGLTDAEADKFSILRVLRTLLPDASASDRKAAGFELEVCAAEAQRAQKEGRETRGIRIPNDILRRALMPAARAGRAMNTGTGGAAAGDTGGYIVANTLLSGSFYDVLRNKTTIMRLGTNMGGLVGNVDIPRKTAASQAYWLGEGQDAAETSFTLGQISLSPKTLAAYMDLTRRLLMQSTPDAEGLARLDLAAAMAQAMDYAGYYGSGTQYQPRGLKNYTGINGKDFAVNGQPSWVELVGMETEIAVDNADVDSMAYVGNARFRGHCKTTQKFPSTPTGATIWEPGNTVNGYRTEVTNQIADADVFFGNFADFIIAMWGGLDIKLDPYALSKSGGLRIVTFQDVDFQVRRVESFCWGSAAVTP